MVDILHRVAVEKTPPDAVYRALTTIDGLAGWWTTDTSGDASEGGVIAFRFPPGGFDMKVVETTPGSHVRWEVVDGPEEWVGTTIDWRLHAVDDWTVVMFEHRGWARPVEFMHHCSTKWATYLMSMKSLLETGAGSPAPHDVHVAFPD
jgi:uncharacterized protein YndB with AHSA1/START domain